MTEEKNDTSTEQDPTPPTGQQLELLQNIARVYDGVQNGNTAALSIVYIDKDENLVRCVTTDGQFTSEAMLLTFLNRIVNGMCNQMDANEQRARSAAMIEAQKHAAMAQAAAGTKDAPDNAENPNVTDKPAGNA